ncbi:MAG: hypothetical protein GC186_20510 [Rhodobacteraceae bacterium]|nr:hypothetical protein [Paracoccaceae bacterium]
MTRHIIDHPRGGKDGDRARAYVQIERTTGEPGPAERVLHRTASTGRDDGQRLREYVKIERQAAE